MYTTFITGSIWFVVVIAVVWLSPGEHPNIDWDVAVRFIESDYEKNRVRFAESTYGILAEDQSKARAHGQCLDSKTDITAYHELGYNIETSVGWAYFLHLHGCLNSTRSYDGSSVFYFFSQHHHLLEEDEFIPAVDSWKWDKENPDNPFMQVYLNLPPEIQKSTFNPARAIEYPSYGLEWPSYKRFFSSSLMKNIGKPIAIVAGKHTFEWNAGIFNTFAESKRLRRILDPLVRSGYQVIYSRPRHIFAGDSPKQSVVDVDDYATINYYYKSNEVLKLDQMVEKIKGLVRTKSDLTKLEIRNIIMCLVYASSDLFVTTQGGNSVIASLFGGQNFILHVRGQEMIQETPKLYVYDRWSKHGGSKVHVCNTIDELVQKLEVFLGQKPAIY